MSLCRSPIPVRLEETVFGRLLVEERTVAFGLAFEDGLQQILFAGEVVAEGSVADTQCLGDLPQGQSLEVASLRCQIGKHVEPAGRVVRLLGRVR
jgi:hypothetical protein